MILLFTFDSCSSLARIRCTYCITYVGRGFVCCFLGLSGMLNYQLSLQFRDFVQLDGGITFSVIFLQLDQFFTAIHAPDETVSAAAPLYYQSVPYHCS
jgi:hypothetical protein